MTTMAMMGLMPLPLGCRRLTRPLGCRRLTRLAGARTGNVLVDTGDAPPAGVRNRATNIVTAARNRRKAADWAAYDHRMDFVLRHLSNT